MSPSRSLQQDLQAANEKLRRSEEQIRAVLDNTADAVVVIDSLGGIVTFNRAASRIFGYSVEEAMGRNVKLLLPPEERERHDSYLERYRRSRVPHILGARREVTAARRDGTLFPIELTVVEVGRQEMFVGVIHDLSERRALQEEVLSVAMLQLGRIGQELHDSTQQELSGLSMLARGLCEALEKRGLHEPAAMAARLSDGIAEANLHVRSLARGIVPVPVRAVELAALLGELARNVELSHGVACRLECPSSFELRDDLAATHLYRIAQEAAWNAVRHAKARSVCIRLEQNGEGLLLEVSDDGIGIEPHAARHGVGLRLMQHRCELIGGRLTVERGKDRGTRVVCTVARQPKP